MPHSEKDFFIEANAVRGISDADYAKEQIDRLAYSRLYILKYSPKSFVEWKNLANFVA